MASAPSFLKDLQLGTYVSPRFEFGAVHLFWCMSDGRFSFSRDKRNGSDVNLEVPGIGGNLNFVADDKPRQHEAPTDFSLPEYLVDETGTRWWLIEKTDQGVHVHYEACSVDRYHHWPVHAKWHVRLGERQYQGLASLNPKDALLHKAGELHTGYPCRSLRRLLVRLFGAIGSVCRFDDIEILEGNCPSPQEYFQICTHCGVQVYEYHEWADSDGKNVPPEHWSKSWACLECGDHGPMLR